jgi:xanthine phosphoribosyltransferase
MSWITGWTKKDNKKKYSWDYIERACKHIADSYNGPPIKRIIGLSRGGLIPAVLIAKHMRVREVYSIGIRSYREGEDYKARSHKPDVYQSIQYTCTRLGRGDPILIVDDISDKGQTFKYVLEHIFENISTSSIIETASIFIKDKTDFEPDHYYKCLPDEQWVIFPWESST